MLNLRKLLGNTSYISFAVQIERVCLLDAFTGLYHKQEILYIMLTTTQHLPRENPPTRGHEMNYVFFGEIEHKQPGIFVISRRILLSQHMVRRF